MQRQQRRLKLLVGLEHFRVYWALEDTTNEVSQMISADKSAVPVPSPKLVSADGQLSAQFFAASKHNKIRARARGHRAPIGARRSIQKRRDLESARSSEAAAQRFWVAPRSPRTPKLDVEEIFVVYAGSGAILARGWQGQRAA
jgi:hypothetical protein